MNTYQRFPKPSIVEDRAYRGVEVIQIDLTVGLEFVEEVKEVEGERSAWAVPCGGEPASAEQLDTGREGKTI